MKYCIPLCNVSEYDCRENTLFEKISSATGRPVFRFRFTGLDSDQFLTLYADYTLNGNINKTLTMSNVPNFRPFASMNTPGNISVSVVNRTVLVYFNGQLLRAGLLDGPIVDQSGPINFGSLSCKCADEQPSWNTLYVCSVYVLYLAILDHALYNVLYLAILDHALYNVAVLFLGQKLQSHSTLLA